MVALVAPGITWTTAPLDASSSVIDQGYVKIAVNLEKVKYIDSTGLSVFVSSQKKLQEKNGRLVIIGAVNKVNALSDARPPAWTGARIREGGRRRGQK